MSLSFHIRCTLKTITGYECFGEFFIGNDRDFAVSVFQQLKGNDEVSEDNVLQLDFIEIKENLPLNLKMIRCTLNEMSENARLITREMFKFYNLKSASSQSF